MDHIQSQGRALLIIDMQVGMFNGPQDVHEGDRLLLNIRQLIDRAREADAPIFAVRHTGPEGSPIAFGSNAWQLLPELGINPQKDKIFEKSRPNCFVGTDLAAQFAANDVREIVIVGMKTEYCVDTTCRAARDYGLYPILVRDAHSTMDGPNLSAQAIIDHHNRTLSGAFVELINTVDCKF